MFPLMCVYVSRYPTDCSPSGSSLHGILQARILERVAVPFSKGSPWPRAQTQVSCIEGRFFTYWATWESYHTSNFLPNLPLPLDGSDGLVAKSYPMDCSPLGFSVQGFSWVKILEWVAISFFRGYFWPRGWTRVLLHGRQILFYWTREAPPTG